MTQPGPRTSASESREPPRYKRAIVIWVALYPAVALAMTILDPVVVGWAIPLRALALTLVVIPAAVWVLLPLSQRLLGGWLTPKDPARERSDRA